MKYRKFNNREVKKTFDAYPREIRNRLLFLREVIFQTAEENTEIGEIEEILKWQSPSYLSHNPKSGTTIRLSKFKGDEGKFAISVHCQTSLISEFREAYSDLDYQANRSIVFDIGSELPMKTLEHFIFLALTYHHRKKT